MLHRVEMGGVLCLLRFKESTDASLPHRSHTIHTLYERCEHITLRHQEVNYLIGQCLKGDTKIACHQSIQVKIHHHAHP